MRKSRIALFIVTLCTFSVAAADDDRIARIEATAAEVAALFEQHAGERHLPGFAYGVVAGGRLVYSGAFGHSNLARQIPASDRSQFRIASMSKSFTALAILQLRDAGKLELDEPAETYLPELADLDYLASDAPRITVRHLLIHAGGFPEDNPWGDRQLADTDADLFNLIEAGVSVSNVPGVEFEYSNLGFALLGQIVQRVSGMPFTEYMAKNVFEPLGMSSTTFEYDDADPERLALGYRWRDGEWLDEPLLHHGSFGAMGGLITSIEDFSRYAALHLSAWPPQSGDDDGILKRSSLREMHHPWNYSGLMADFAYADGRKCPMATAYAYGLSWRSDCEGRVYVRHSGGLPGFGSDWNMLPDYDLAVVSFDNLTYASTDGINVRVLEAIIAAAGLEPRPFPVSEILERRKEELVEALLGYDLADFSELFAENFFLDSPLDIRREELRTLIAEIGQVVGVGPLRAENRLRGTFVIDGELGDLEVFFTLTPEAEPLIQQLNVTAIDQ